MSECPCVLCWSCGTRSSLSNRALGCGSKHFSLATVFHTCTPTMSSKPRLTTPNIENPALWLARTKGRAIITTSFSRDGMFLATGDDRGLLTVCYSSYVYAFYLILKSSRYTKLRNGILCMSVVAVSRCDVLSGIHMSML